MVTPELQRPRPAAPRVCRPHLAREPDQFGLTSWHPLKGTTMSLFPQNADRLFPRSPRQSQAARRPAQPGNVLRIGIGTSLNTLDSDDGCRSATSTFYANLAFNGLTRHARRPGGRARPGRELSRPATTSRNGHSVCVAASSSTTVRRWWPTIVRRLPSAAARSRQHRSGAQPIRHGRECVGARRRHGRVQAQHPLWRASPTSCRTARSRSCRAARWPSSPPSRSARVPSSS